MRRSLVHILSCTWLALACAIASAAAGNPTLTARDSGIDDDNAKPVSLDISDLEVMVDIVGNVARTTVAARFTNPGGNDLEGTFTLQMPDGAVVTSYALDVGDEMIDGVLAPPIRARRAYEARLRRGIDPGVAEVARGNVFSTRVYPVLADQGRRIRLSFTAPVHPTQGFSLPLAISRKAARVGLSVRVRGTDPSSGSSPGVAWPADVRSEWLRDSSGMVNEVVLRNRSIAGVLHVDPARNDGRAIVTRHPSGKRFVELRDTFAGSLPATVPPRSVRVYWDRSLSRADDSLAAELALLERYLAASRPGKIDVVTFNSSGATTRAVPDTAAAVALLRTAQYRGASSFRALARGAQQSADVCLLFSDGVANLDSRPEQKLGCTLFVITSAPDADRGYLELLARLNGGALLGLGRDNADELLARLRSPAPRIVEVRSTENVALRFAPLPATARGWALVAEAPASGDLVVRIAGIAAGEIERRYALTADGGRFSGAGALWASDRVSQLVGDGRREEELRELSRRYSVASPAMSFVVLESPADYVVSKLAPPATYPKAALAEYHEFKRRYDADTDRAREAWLDRLVSSWDRQKQWWAQDFSPDAYSKKLAEAKAAEARRSRAADEARQQLSRAAGAAPRREAMNSVQAIHAESLEEVSVTGMRGSGGAEISVELAPWSVDRPYLKALEDAGAKEFERAFAAQAKRYGSLPAFWFDVAEWLHRRERTAEATEMLLSALDLPSRDTETLSVVADRLLRYGHIDRAIWLYEEVVRLDPDRPQPVRTLALALEKRAVAPGARKARTDLERSLALLSGIVMTPPADAYQGIELVCLMDANGIIPQLRALGATEFPLDSRLITLLDVDLRVVIEWNTGATDMDLWVDQPDGERSIYSNPRTAIGGRLSNDMTQGFGPEEYLLRRAITGEYAISVNVYASDVINPNGATMVTAHLTRNYGRADQRTETMEIELKPEDSGERLVGHFNVGARSGLSSR